MRISISTLKELVAVGDAAAAEALLLWQRFASSAKRSVHLPKAYFYAYDGNIAFEFYEK